MNYKEKMLAELKGFLDMEALDGRISINFLGARLFYDLLIKDIKEDKEMEGGKLVNSLAEVDMPEKIVTLRDTEDLMISADYKKRFVAEYFQTKIRYEKLRAFNNKIEAARMNLDRYPPFTANRNLVMPEHDCPDHLLENQQHIMGEYLHIMELRAVIEGIDLDLYK